MALLPALLILIKGLFKPGHSH